MPYLVCYQLSNTMPDSRPVCLLLSTGDGSIDSDQTASAVTSLRQKGVQVVVAGMGPRVNGSELSLVANSDSSVVYVDNWTDERSMTLNGDRLNDKICSK